MWNKVDKELTKMCKNITGGLDIAQDLKQEVILLLFKHKGSEDLFYSNENEFFAMAFKFCYSVYYKRNSPFNKVERYFKNPYIEVDNKDDYFFSLIEEDEEVEVNLDYYTNGLSEMDKLWLSEYCNNNNSYSALSDRTKIDRVSISNRMNEIFNKIRK